MTREVASTLVLSARGRSEECMFEQYAGEAEQHEGVTFWNTFATVGELLRDFELYIRYNNRPLI